MNPKRGAVPFPMAGKGAYLRFDLDALATVEESLGEEWWMGVLTSLDGGILGLRAPAKLIKQLLALCVFDATGSLLGPESIGDRPIRETYAPLRDALAQAVNGTNYETAVKEIQDRAASAEAEAVAARINGGQADENPPKPAAQSNGSAAAPTG